jgi:hypothetical protein
LVKWKKDWKTIKIFWGNTFLFFWRELVVKRKRVWISCSFHSYFVEIVGRRVHIVIFWGEGFEKKQEDINTCKIKNWKKSLSLMGFLRKFLPLGNPPQKKN